MQIAISGSSGLVGAALVASLERKQHTVLRLVRKPPDRTAPHEIPWDPDRGVSAPERLSGLDAVVHLAGKPIAAGKWTADAKREIRDSRVAGTQALAAALANADPPPRLLISASAVGYYGSRGDEELDEASAPGDDFLAAVCRDWEDAALSAAAHGIRVAVLRLGMVIAPHGGALEKMLPPFKAGVGGRLGSGRQWVSWVALPDVVGAVQFVIDRGGMAGPINMVAPAPITNAEFTQALGAVLHRPTLFPVPAFAMRAMFGEMADALLLASQRVTPRALTTQGFSYRHPDITDALTWAIGQR